MLENIENTTMRGGEISHIPNTMATELEGIDLDAANE